MCVMWGGGTDSAAEGDCGIVNPLGSTELSKSTNCRLLAESREASHFI